MAAGSSVVVWVAVWVAAPEFCRSVSSTVGDSSLVDWALEPESSCCMMLLRFWL